MSRLRASTMRVLGALAALLFAAGVVGVVTVSGDNDDDSLHTAASSSSTAATSAATSSSSSTSTSTAVATTVAPSGLATGGSATVQGSGHMADTGGSDLLFPGLVLLGCALGVRRLRAHSVG